MLDSDDRQYTLRDLAKEDPVAVEDLFWRCWRLLEHVVGHPVKKWWTGKKPEYIDLSRWLCGVGVRDYWKEDGKELYIKFCSLAELDIKLTVMGF